MALTDKVAFCTLAEVKDDLGITDSASDAALERRILLASSMIEAYCGRKFRREVDRVEKLAGYGTARLLPSLLPIESVASITYDTSLIPASNYEVERTDAGEGWAIYAAQGWRWTAPGVQTVSDEPVPQPGQERRLFSVTYTGGFTLPNDTDQTGPALPFTLREACALLAVTLWKGRGRDGNVVAESAGDASVQYGYLGGVAAAPNENGGLPGAIAAMVQPWRRAA